MKSEERYTVALWPAVAADRDEYCIKIGGWFYTPDEAREFAAEITARVAEADVLLRPEVPVPHGWERCHGARDCDEAGKWGAGVDPHDHTKWRRWHAWHSASPSHGFLIHQRCVPEEGER